MNRVKKFLLLAVFVAASLVSVNGSKGATSCHVGFWTAGRYYHGTVTRSIHTSCPFARNVTRNSLHFIVTHGGVGDGDFYVFAYSPVTLKNYRMHCWANGDLRSFDGMRVDCRGGIGARVIYRAWGS